MLHDRREVVVRVPTFATPASSCLSSGEIELVIQLLMDLRETTQSRTSHSKATKLIIEFGGADRIGPAAVCASGEWSI